MILYDDKTENAIKSGNRLLLSAVEQTDDIIFQASYIISGDLCCSGKISALFDLIVLGDVSADEIDIKGRFVCTGRCVVAGAMIVQNDIWAEDIQAKSIVCHDRIVAQFIDADTVVSDSNIIIGTTLAIAEKAQTTQNIICGETAYGAGKIAASRILTVEELDLDDGEGALESPFQYTTVPNPTGSSSIAAESAKYALHNDYSGYLEYLSKTADQSTQELYRHYRTALKEVDSAYPASISEFNDAALLIWMIEISNSEYFKDWPKIKEWTDSVLLHFKNIAEGKFEGLHTPKPATTLEKGYTVLHGKYGTGIVRSIFQVTIRGDVVRTAIVEFERYGEKKFPLPSSLGYFQILSKNEVPFANRAREAIRCNINGYIEWLSALQLVYVHKDYLGSSLYEIIYGLLLSTLGLKPKFFEDRFKEKGWE